MQLSIALKTGREETMRGMGLHRIAQLNDIEAAGGVASFCQLLHTEVEELQKAVLDMLANLIALQNGAGNELSAGEAFSQSGACAALVKVLGNRVMEMQMGRPIRPDVERKALRVVFHICKSKACQNALRNAGAGIRLREILAFDSSAPLEPKIEAARCLKKYVRKNTENILELTGSGGVALLCRLLGDFIELRSNSLLEVNGTSPEDSFDVAMEAILSTICECIHVSEVHGSRGLLQFPSSAIPSFVAILQKGDRMNRMLASQVLIQVSLEPTMIAMIAKEREFIKEMMWMLDNEDDCAIASEILYGLCQTTPKPDVGSIEDPHEHMLRMIYELDVFDLVLKKLKACVVGEDHFVGEINFQKNLLGIMKCFSAESAAYADYICSRECVPALSAFLMSKKTSLVPLCAQTLMNLCDFNPAIFNELLDRNASDFFQRLLQTPPDENRFSALRYFGALLDNGCGFSIGVLDTLFLMASGRDVALKTKSLEILAKLTGIKSITSLLDPLQESTNPEIVELVSKLRERVVGTAFFPGLMNIISTSGDTEARVNAIKCIRCAIDGGDEIVARMVELDVFRVFCVVMRKWMDVSADSSTLSEKQISTAVLQLLYLILNSSTSLIASAGEDDVNNLVTVVTEFIVSQPSRLAMGIRIVRLFITDRAWKNCFFTLYAVDSSTTGHDFLQALMNGIEQSSVTAGQSPNDTVFEDCMTVLKELVLESSNESMVNLLISGGVHTSLLELMREETNSSLVRQALVLIDSLTQTRRVRLLILEAGAALTALVGMYDRTTLLYGELDPEHQAISRKIGHILVNLSSDPLEFRKMLYDHRSVLPGAILRNILSSLEDVSVIAEDIVLNLVESDFATCPLWINLIETSDIQLAYKVMIVAKRSSVQVTAARKLTDIVFSTPEKLEDEETGLSATERATLVSTLIGFLVDFDPRTSVIGILALTLLLKHGQSFNEEQMQKVAVDGAISLVYWIQKGTERHQENAVSILHDGVTDPRMMSRFYEQLKSSAVMREATFIIEMGQQIVDIDIHLNPDGVFKRCDLLTGILDTMDLGSLSGDCLEIVDEVTLYLLKFIRGEEQVDVIFLPKILYFLTIQAASEELRRKLSKQGVIGSIVGLLQEQKDSPNKSPEVLEAAQRLLKQMCMDDIQQLIAVNGVGILVDILNTSDTGLVDVTEALELFSLIVSSGAAGEKALMESAAVTSCLERAFDGIFSECQGELSEVLLADNFKKLQLACGVCSLVFSLSRSHLYREQVLLTSQLVEPIIKFLEWIPSNFASTESLEKKVYKVLTSGLAFLEGAIISEEQSTRSEDTRGKLYRQIRSVYVDTLRTFANGHENRELFIIACEGLVTFHENAKALAALDASMEAELHELLAIQGTAALEGGLYSRDCAIAVLELIFAVVSEEKKGTAADQLAWVVELVLHVMTKNGATESDFDMTTVLLLLNKFCKAHQLRQSILDHTSYPKLVDALVGFTSEVQWKRYRRHSANALALLGEAEALDRALISVYSAPGVTFTSQLDNVGAREEFAVRCFHCRQIVHVPAGANACLVPCPYCQKPAAEALDGSTRSVEPLPSVQEDSAAADQQTRDSDARRKADSVQEINCQNCTRLITLPEGMVSTDFACPYCYQSPTISKLSSQSVETHKSATSAESGGSTGSSSTVDVRDTKVVSCGHCSKHLIVKNGASAVKCPSCQGVSKLSTTTSTVAC